MDRGGSFSRKERREDALKAAVRAANDGSPAKGSGVYGSGSGLEKIRQAKASLAEVAKKERKQAKGALEERVRALESQLASSRETAARRMGEAEETIAKLKAALKRSRRQAEENEAEGAARNRELRRTLAEAKCEASKEVEGVGEEMTAAAERDVASKQLAAARKQRVAAETGRSAADADKERRALEEELASTREQLRVAEAHATVAIARAQKTVARPAPHGATSSLLSEAGAAKAAKGAQAVAAALRKLSANASLAGSSAVDPIGMALHALLDFDIHLLRNNTPVLALQLSRAAPAAIKHFDVGKDGTISYDCKAPGGSQMGSALVDLIMVPAPGQEPFLPQKGDRLGVHVADRRSAKEDVLHREVNCINVEEVLSTVEQMKAKGAAKRFALWTDPLHSWTWGVDEATGRWCLQRARARLMLMRCFNELSEGIIAQIMAA